MTLYDNHVKTARAVFQPCVEAFDQDFANDNEIVDHSNCTDSDVIKQHVWIAGYENLLAGD